MPPILISWVEAALTERFTAQADLQFSTSVRKSSRRSDSFPQGRLWSPREEGLRRNTSFTPWGRSMAAQVAVAATVEALMSAAQVLHARFVLFDTATLKAYLGAFEKLHKTGAISPLKIERGSP